MPRKAASYAYEAVRQLLANEQPPAVQQLSSSTKGYMTWFDQHKARLQGFVPRRPWARDGKCFGNDAGLYTSFARFVAELPAPGINRVQQRSPASAAPSPAVANGGRAAALERDAVRHDLLLTRDQDTQRDEGFVAFGLDVRQNALGQAIVAHVAVECSEEDEEEGGGVDVRVGDELLRACGMCARTEWPQLCAAVASGGSTIGVRLLRRHQSAALCDDCGQVLAAGPRSMHTHRTRHCTQRTGPRTPMLAAAGALQPIAATSDTRDRQRPRWFTQSHYHSAVPSQGATMNEYNKRHRDKPGAARPVDSAVASAVAAAVAAPAVVADKKRKHDLSRLKKCPKCGVNATSNRQLVCAGDLCGHGFKDVAAALEPTSAPSESAPARPATPAPSAPARSARRSCHASGPPRPVAEPSRLQLAALPDDLLAKVLALLPTQDLASVSAARRPLPRARPCCSVQFALHAENKCTPSVGSLLHRPLAPALPAAAA